MARINRLAVNAAVSLGLLLVPATVLVAQQYPFLPVPGAPKNIRTLFQDSRGGLWIGGDETVLFDGSRFFPMRDYGLPAGRSYQIAEDPSGAIWIAAESGVYRFFGGRVEALAKGVAVSISLESPDLAVAAIGELGQGPPTAASLVRIQRSNGAWKSETVMNLDSPGPITLDHGGMLLYPWLIRGWKEVRLSDVAAWRAGAKIPVTEHMVDVPGGPPGAGNIKYIRDRFGCIWMGTEHKNWYECAENQMHPAPYAGSEMFAGQQESPDGTILLAGPSVLAVGRPGAFQTATLTNGLPSMLTAIRGIDRTIWIGTGQGLYRFASPWQLEFWTQREGVKAAYSLLANGGKMYAGLERQIGVLSKDRQRWVALKSFVSPGIVMSLVPAGGGTLMAALNPGGVSQLRADGVILGRNKKIQNGLKLAQDGDGALWIGCEGLERIWPGGSVLKSKGQPLEIKPSSNMLDIQYEPKTQKLWGCYSGGLIVREPGDHWREFHKKDGLQTNPCWSLAALPNGDVWYGYFNVGAFALLRPDGRNGYSVRQYHAGGEIDDPESYIFDADQNGLLWRGGAKGISVADPASAEAGNWLYLDPSDGLPAAGVNNGAFLADSDGSVWWGADNTISHYTPPSDLIHPKFAPKVWVSAFSLNGGGAKLAESLDKIPNGAKTVAHIGSLQFERRNSLRLRYRVLPEQTNWTETRNLDVPLGTVSWGSHQLEVQGRIFGGLWSGTVTRSFSVLSPVWLSWPWPLVYFAGLLMSSTAIYFERRRRIADQQQIFPNLDDIRLKVFAPEVRKFAGQRFEERYEVRRHVGKGGFANVFIGYDYEEKRRCAIKIFRPEVSSSAALMRGFKQEVSALRKVRHRNVVEIYAHGIAAPETPYLVMEFIEGQSLRTILDEAGPLPRKRIARFLRQLAGALDAIHSIGICHRDLKPENLMVRQKEGTEEELVLIDFSIAIVKDATESIHGVSRAAGTFDYMAPEQAIGYARPSSDLYSLAKLLVEMLTGQRLAKLLPNAALDLPERIKQMATAMPWGLSADSVALLSAALEFDPTKRPDRAGDFARPIMKDLEAGD